MPNGYFDSVHRSVMRDECIEILGALRGGVYVDATLGLGGHSEGILLSSPDAIVFGIDQDEQALALATDRLLEFGKRFTAVKSNFSDLASVLKKLGVEGLDGVLADLGVSSLQLDSETRGFSFRFDAPLDMRMDAASGGETAGDLLNRLGQEELADIIYRYGDERASRKIARWIIEKRDAGTPISTTFELAELVKRAVKTSSKEKTHPATRTFQALRIAVNSELDILSQFIQESVELLKPDGVLAIITFHSIEDRIVKHAFQMFAGKCQCPPRIPECRCGAAKKVEILTKKPILPTGDEQENNPRSRSAKLRACRKLG